VDVSSVLEAMQVPVEWAMGTVRFSVGRETTEEQIDRAVEVVTAAVRSLQPGAAMAAPTLVTDVRDESLARGGSG
jgi:cysteine sulfinate desulfinase/cysteine desulfurase-like protein